MKNKKNITQKKLVAQSPQYNDKELVKKLKQNKKHFELVYKQYYRMIVNYFKKRVNNASISEDLASEVFEKAMNAIDDFKWQGVSLSVWLFRIARNRLTDYYRKVGKVGKDMSLTEIENLFEDEEVSISDEVEQEENDRVLFDALREFKEDEQYLIYYKFFEDLSNKEIAQIVKISESNVGTKLYRIRKKLKKYLNRNPVFER